MRSVPRLWLAVIPCLALLFALSSWLLLRMLPGPLKPLDYMIVGTFATGISMLVFFLALTFRSRNVFFKKRNR